MKNPLYDVIRFYYEGFRDMKLGKTLWFTILIKLFIIFFILKIFFFPNFLNSRFDSENQKADFVGSQLVERGKTDK
jgi:hypothetical protein